MLDRRGHVVIWNHLQKLAITCTSSKKNGILLSEQQIFNHNKCQYFNMLPAKTLPVGLQLPNSLKHEIIQDSKQLLYLQKFILPRVNSFTG